MAQKINYNLELLTKFCSENNITLLKDYSNESNKNDKPKIRLVQNLEELTETQKSKVYVQ